MKKSFIIGMVWTGVIIGVVSFGTTIFLLNKDNNNEVSQIVYNDTTNSKKINTYITNESSVRTNTFKESNNKKMENIIEIDEEDINDLVINKSENIEIIGDELEDSLESFSDNAKVSISTSIKPVNGDIIKPLAIDNLLYSKTLNEWTVHNGIDYEAKLGDEVHSIRNGKIKEINFDYAYGNYIVVEHGDGYESLYANITALDALKIGQTIKQGQLIGYVAESFGYEAADVTHLHFELKKDGKYIDIGVENN